MPKFGTDAAVIVVTLVLAVVLVGIVYSAESSKPSIPIIKVVPGSAYFQNFTISCYGCVAQANDKNLWQGRMTLGNIPLDINGSNPNSTALGVTQGIAVPITPSSPCLSGMHSNSSCIYSVGSLPFNMTFNIKKTSTGGTLRVILYLTYGNPLRWQTTSGYLNETVRFESA